MKKNSLRAGFVIAALFAFSSTLSGLGHDGWYSTKTALAASPQEKA
jgi:hypothetical protein